MNFDDPKFTSVHHRNVWGEWTFVFEGSKLCKLDYNGPEGTTRAKVPPSSVFACAGTKYVPEEKLPSSTASAYRKVVAQLNEFLAGKRKTFNVAVKLYGTPFQINVWEALKEIPFGETRTYKQIAELVESPKAVRAVGGALHANPIPLILPCHRVVGTDGKLVGFALGLDLKRRLLILEGAIQNEMILE